MSLLKRLLPILVVLIGLLLAVRVAGKSSLEENNPIIINDTVVIEEVWSEDRILALIDQKANEYNVSAWLMTEIIRCESNFVTDIQSKHQQPYGREQSYGLVQIHLPAHPGITREQAIDPTFAVSFLARNLSIGKGDMWTCYRKIT